MRLTRWIGTMALATGLSMPAAIAEELGLTRTTVLLWRTRFAEGGCDALVEDAPRSGRARREAEPTGCRPA
jgi:transposase